MITGIDELKKLTKHILCECKCKFDRKKYQCECEKYNAYEKKKIIFGILLHVVAEMENIYVKYLVITCDEIIDVEAKSYDEERKAIPTSSNEKKVF